MKIKRILSIFIIGSLLIGLLGLLIFIYACGRLSPFIGNAQTKLTSTTLASTASLQSMSGNVNLLNNSYAMTPINISGEALSILFPIAGQEDEGIVVYGDGRPDIAKPDSELKPFDLAQITTFSGPISGKPGYVGGLAYDIMLIFGHFDVGFRLGGTTEVVRVIYGNTGDYVRGDKLLKNKTSGEFEWYNPQTSTFAATRPSSPAAIAVVRDWQASAVRPEEHYFSIGATLNTPISLTKTEVENNNWVFTVDFNLGSAITFTGGTSAPTTEAEIIQRFDMVQNTAGGWGNSGLYCDVTVQKTPR